ncbi:MAG: hypothetical protein ACI8WB_004924 [Phenylobacterium sp.]|jgi:uncharacterized protein (DUF885 family)
MTRQTTIFHQTKPHEPSGPTRPDKPGKNIKRTVTTLLGLALLGGCEITVTDTSNTANTFNATAQASDHQTAPVATATTQFTALMNEIWQYLLQQDPLKANDSDNNDYNDRLEDLSPEAFEKRNTRLKQYISNLDAIERHQLAPEDQINLDILRREISGKVDKYRFKYHYVPLKAESGFHTEMAYLPTVMPFRTERDFVNYLARLSALPVYFAQNIHWMKQGISSGYTQPRAIFQGFENGIKTFIVDDPTTSLYYGPLKKKRPLGISESRFNQLKSQAADVIRTKVLPAYQHFHDFFVQTYLPATRQSIGLSEVPDGKDFYQNRVKFYTTTDESAEQVHQLGLQEVARIRGEMDKIIEQLKFIGSFADFIQFLRTDQQFYATSAEQLLKEASYIAKKMDGKLPSLFRHLPRTPYTVNPVPDHLAPKYTTGRYLNASQDDQPGQYWVNTYRLDRRPLYVLEALTLHEAVPGHHLQSSIGRELSRLPPHRRYSYISAFGEGWGLYSEFLGIEAGFYQDPYSNFGRLTYEMWRACRLVVDTGMHIKGWGRQRAMDYLQSNTALSVHNVKTEIDRYIAWPGQALSYKMGELTIKRLRREAEVALGDKFDLREFHDQVLKHGSVPLKVLENQIKGYVAEVLAE